YKRVFCYLWPHFFERWSNVDRPQVSEVRRGAGRPVVGLPTLTWLRAFEAAARTSSFTAAAVELRLTPGAISYQIRALEGHLGFALFERLPRGVKLTPMGVAYLPPVRKAFEKLADSTVGLFGSSERMQITV